MKTKYILIIVALGICISMGVQHLSADNQQYVDIAGILEQVYWNNEWIYGCDCDPPAETAECYCRVYKKPNNQD